MILQNEIRKQKNHRMNAINLATDCEYRRLPSPRISQKTKLFAKKKNKKTLSSERLMSCVGTDDGAHCLGCAPRASLRILMAFAFRHLSRDIVNTEHYLSERHSKVADEQRIAAFLGKALIAFPLFHAPVGFMHKSRAMRYSLS